MASLLEYVGCVHIYLGPYRGNPIALYLKRSDHDCRIGPKAYPWNDVVGIGETPNKAAADFEEKWKGKGLTADLYSGPSWEGGIKPEKPAPPKPAVPPKPATPASSQATTTTAAPASSSPKSAAPAPSTVSAQPTAPAQPGTGGGSSPSAAQKPLASPTHAPAASPQKAGSAQPGAASVKPPASNSEHTPSAETPVPQSGTSESSS